MDVSEPRCACIHGLATRFCYFCSQSLFCFSDVITAMPLLVVPLGEEELEMALTCLRRSWCRVWTTVPWPVGVLPQGVDLCSRLRAAGCRHKATVQFLNRPDLPKLAYQKIKGKNPGVIFLPGYASNMNGQKAVALEDFCNSLGHSFVRFDLETALKAHLPHLINKQITANKYTYTYIGSLGQTSIQLFTCHSPYAPTHHSIQWSARFRFDYTGCGSSEGDIKECTVGRWKKDVLSVLDELSDGPQILVGSSLGGWLMLLAAIARPEKVAALVGVAAAADHFVTSFNQLTMEVKKEIEDKRQWKIPTKYNEEGFYDIPYNFVKEAENHCLLNTPIPITSPIKLIHGMKDEDVPWHVSMQIAERVLSPDVDVILRKNGQHRLSEKDDIKLLVYTIDDLIDKLTTLG